MKKLLLLGNIIAVTGLVHATTINAPSSLVGSGELNGQDAYSWGISIPVPAGDEVVSAQINFTDITLSEADPNGTGILYVDLLNSKNTGVKVVSEGAGGNTTYDYWTTVFASANMTSLKPEKFTSVGTMESWSDVLTPSELSNLNTYLTDNGGVFDIGLDPNCSYMMGKISFTYTLGGEPHTVPDVATTAFLLAFGLAGSEVFRRRMVCASVKA